tara:strand:+ start:75 stop:1400 length:1326 start_codon:yes stop_codon:yes gene_type:complete
MSQEFKSKTTFINLSGVEGSGSDYREVTTVTGEEGNYTFSTVIQVDRKKDKNWEEIGTKNQSGVITLNKNASSNEKKYLNTTLKDQLKANSENLVDKVSAGLTLKPTELIKLKEGLNLPVSTADLVDAVNEGTDLINSISIKGRNFRKEYAHYSYPEGLKSNKQDRIRFEQVYSEGTKITTALDSRSFQRKIKNIKGSVTLPIVTGIGDQNNVNWKGATLNPIQSTAAALALNVFEGARAGNNINEIVQSAGNAFNDAKAVLATQAGDDIRSGINVYLAQQAVGAQNLLSRTTGAIANPNLELLFTGPQLREFGFTFRLSPRDAEEATQVRKILRFFKQGMSVKTSSSNVFLKAPNIFKIRYQTFNTNGDEIEHPSINFIKTCALTSCDVQYTPDGSYMTYEDAYRTLTAYQLTLRFGELDPIYDSDYTELDDDDDQVIGY